VFLENSQIDFISKTLYSLLTLPSVDGQFEPSIKQAKDRAAARLWWLAASIKWSDVVFFDIRNIG